jgi:hypothetical protein
MMKSFTLESLALTVADSELEEAGDSWISEFFLPS